MKALILMIFSVLLSGVVCLALVNGGIVTINNSNLAALFDSAKSNILPSFEKMLSSLNRGSSEGPSDELMPDKSKTPEKYGLQTASSEPPESAITKRAKAAAQPVNYVMINDSNEAYIDEEIYQKSMAFFSSWSGDGNEVEDAYRGYLINEQHLASRETFRFMKICFWKNFVTLQEKWPPEKEELLRLTFTREKALKSAGFAACGLSLMANNIHEAEEQVNILSLNLSGGNPGSMSQ